MAWFSIYLELGVYDLHMIQLMPLPPHHLLVLSFWCWLTQVVLETHTQPFYCSAGICPGLPG